MASNLEIFNLVSQSWACNFNLKNKFHLREVEDRVVELLISKSLDSLSKEEEYELGSLLKKKVDLLALEESKWRLISRAIWL